MYIFNHQPLLKDTRMLRKHTRVKWNMMTDCKDTRTDIKLESVYKKSVIIEYSVLKWTHKDHWVQFLNEFHTGIEPTSLELGISCSHKLSDSKLNETREVIAEMQHQNNFSQDKANFSQDEVCISRKICKIFGLGFVWFSFSFFFFFSLHLNRIKTTGEKKSCFTVFSAPRNFKTWSKQMWK